MSLVPQYKISHFKALSFFNRSFQIKLVLCMTFLFWNFTAQAQTAKQWVGTWASAVYKAADKKPPVSFDNYTLRQIVRVSIGGDSVRVKFSNITSVNPVTIKKVNIAVSPDGTKSAVTASTIKYLTFKGDSSVTMSAKSTTTSDPVAFDLKPGSRLAITIYYSQCKSADDMAFHYGSRTNSYYISGDKTASADFNGTAIERWFTLSNIDVCTPSNTAAAVAVIGNSITDGYGLTGGLQNRWTDVFSERLLANAATKNVGVLNLGIGGTMVTRSSNGADAGVNRFEQDVLSQQGLRWVIIFYGVNDIDAEVGADSIISGIKKMAAAAHAKNLQVYGATITPFKNNDYYTSDHEKVRSAVNKWIRTDGGIDGYFDFDKAIRDPSDTTKMKESLKNDWLHPNVEGYKAIGQSVDLKYFEIPVTVKEQMVHKASSGALSISQYCGNSIIDFSVPYDGYVSLKIYSLLGKEIAELAGSTFSSGRHTITFSNESIAKGMYFCTLRAKEFSANQRIVY